jgi:hypothetical protein
MNKRRMTTMMMKKCKRRATMRTRFLLLRGKSRRRLHLKLRKRRWTTPRAVPRKTMPCCEFSVGVNSRAHNGQPIAKTRMLWTATNPTTVARRRRKKGDDDGDDGDEGSYDGDAVAGRRYYDNDRADLCRTQVEATPTTSKYDSDHVHGDDAAETVVEPT